MYAHPGNIYGVTCCRSQVIMLHLAINFKIEKLIFPSCSWMANKRSCFCLVCSMLGSSATGSVSSEKSNCTHIFSYWKSCVVGVNLHAVLSPEQVFLVLVTPMHTVLVGGSYPRSSKSTLFIKLRITGCCCE